MHAWRQRANAAAAYYLTLFVPWDSTAGVPSLELTWAKFVWWYRLWDPCKVPVSAPVDAADADIRVVEVSRRQCVANIMGGLRVNSGHKAVLLKDRSRCAQRWNPDDPAVQAQATELVGAPFVGTGVDGLTESQGADFTPGSAAGGALANSQLMTVIRAMRGVAEMRYHQEWL
jgi:hypothetical protein